jgi:hypothetical protein
MALANTVNSARTCRSSLGVRFFRLRSAQPKLIFQDAQARDIGTKAARLCIKTSSRNCLAKSLCKAECWLTCLPAGNLHSLVWYVSTLHFLLSAFPLVTHHLCTSDGEGSPSPRQMRRAPYLGSRWGVLPIRSSDGESSLSGLEMGRAPCPGLRWGELPIRASDGKSSLSGLQIGRALYLGCGWGVLPIA